MKNNNTNTREIEFRRAHFKDEEQKEFLYFTSWGVNVGIHQASFTSPTSVSSSSSHVDQQYTSKKDKSGSKIFEGDILKDDVGDILEVKFGELPLDKSGDCVCTYPAFYCKCYGKLGSAPSHECQEIGEWMEVIGTIYETPHLINQ